MKRDREEEKDLSEPLRFFDDEATSPSDDADNHWEPELDPKHTIFLSHSGVQKNFTEQLCVDLERWEYSPFFDKRPDSVPKGRQFSELIFQAARQCRVAILVLSEDFFTRTKWPMLELEAFVQSQKDNPGKLEILPVYFGLSLDECTRNETRRRHWLSVWRGWAKTDDRIDVVKWEDALKVLGPSNGIEYVESLGEAALREQIVSVVRRLIPPESSWSGAHVQGRTRILKAMGKLGNLNVVLQEGIINSISSTEPRMFVKLIYKHTTYTTGILRGERNKFVCHEHFTFRIDSWEPVDVLEICIDSGASQVGECKVLLSVFINLEENLQADRKDFVIRTEDLLVDKRSVGSIKVAGSFSTLHELDVLRAIVKGNRPELHPPRIPPSELPGLPNYASITNEIRGEGEIEADIFHTDKSKPEVQLEFKEILNAGKPTSIGDYLPIDLTRDLLGASSRGYVISTICLDGEGRRHPCALKRIDTTDASEPDLARLRHPHVVHLLHHWKEKIDYGEVREWMPKSAFMTFLMMELMEGDLGNLMTSIKTTGLPPFPLLVAVLMMLQIAKGMLYLHEMGVSHPHVKCENVLCRVKSTARIPFRVGDVLVKLGGFGCSRAANDDTMNRDVFCFGLTCLEILTGNECLEDIYGADKVSRPSIPETTPCILRDCIASCLDTEITFSEAISLLLLAQSQIIQTCEDKMISCSVNLHTQSTLSNKQDLASSSTSKSDRQEMFHVHQLHPQLGEVATSVQITLIFFHGFPKVPEEWRMTWLTRDNRLVWPQMWLPEDLDGDIRVLSVSFDDRPNVSSIQSIKDLLQILVMSATCKLGETDEAIVLVGHSFGGVIIKALVAAAQGLAGKTVENNAEFEEILKCRRFLERLASIVFYSVPHAFKNEEFENYISGCGNTRVLQRSCLLKALRRDSVFISDMIQLSRNFENAVPRKTKLLAFLEGKPMIKKSLLVTENSREGLLPTWEWHKIDRDNHFEVCRPVSRSHIGYKVLLDHLQQHMCSPSAVNEVSGRRRLYQTVSVEEVFRRRSSEPYNPDEMPEFPDVEIRVRIRLNQSSIPRQLYTELRDVLNMDVSRSNSEGDLITVFGYPPSYDFSEHQIMEVVRKYAPNAEVFSESSRMGRPFNVHPYFSRDLARR